MDTAVKVSNGTIANLNINFANDVAVHVKHNSLIYRVVAGNTGVKSLTTTMGYGFIVWGMNDGKFKDFAGDILLKCKSDFTRTASCYNMNGTLKSKGDIKYFT